MTVAYDCTQQGHIWREGSRPVDPKDYPSCPLYARHRIAAPEGVAVFCEHCDATATLERQATNSGLVGPVSTG
jgi:hypothetical protein